MGLMEGERHMQGRRHMRGQHRMRRLLERLLQELLLPLRAEVRRIDSFHHRCCHRLEDISEHSTLDKIISPA